MGFIGLELSPVSVTSHCWLAGMVLQTPLPVPIPQSQPVSMMLDVNSLVTFAWQWNTRGVFASAGESAASSARTGSTHIARRIAHLRPPTDGEGYSTDLRVFLLLTSRPANGPQPA